MSRKIFNFFAGAGLLALLGVAPLPAQTGSTMIVAQVPFAFVVGDRTLPAGEYVVRPGGPLGLMIQSTAGKATIFTLPLPIEGSRVEPHPWLVFKQYGDTYFLSELWKAGNNAGHKLRMSSLERELAQGKATPEVRSIVAQQR